MKLCMGKNKPKYSNYFFENRNEWMDFIYDVNNTTDGYKLVNKDNVHHLYTQYDCRNGRRYSYENWNVTNEIRNKIIHNK